MVPGKPWRYRAVWGLEAGGKFTGWVSQADGKIVRFTGPATHKLQETNEDVADLPPIFFSNN
jgi:hypothetical protein